MSHPRTVKALRQLEGLAAGVLSHTYGLAIKPVVSPFLAAGDAYGAREALGHVVQTGYLGPAANLRDRLAPLIEKMAHHGALDITHQIAAAVREAGVPLSRVLPVTPRIVAADADLYQAGATRIMHEHLRATATEVSETILRGINDGRTAKEIGGQLHSLEVRIPVRNADGDVTGYKGGLLRTWADTWAVTETTRYYNLGRVRVAEAAGDNLWGYRYSVIQDEHTTDECMELVDVLVPKDEAAPDPPFHWRCRTEKVAVLSDEIGGRDSIGAYQNRGEDKGFPDGWQAAEGFGGSVWDQLYGRAA